jgi:hypothetical protein
MLVQVRYGPHETPQTVYALNVSERGLFIELDERKPIGTRVFVQVTSKDGALRARGEGRVVRHESGGCGVELSGFAEADQKVLDAIVRAVIGSADGGGSA